VHCIVGLTHVTHLSAVSTAALATFTVGGNSPSKRKDAVYYVEMYSCTH